MPTAWNTRTPAVRAFGGIVFGKKIHDRFARDPSFAIVVDPGAPSLGSLRSRARVRAVRHAI
jgi:hypothetical protein